MSSLVVDQKTWHACKAIRFQKSICADGPDPAEDPEHQVEILRDAARQDEVHLCASHGTYIRW